jgi:hypothetical protein
VTDNLLSTVIEAACGQTPWNTLRDLTVDLSIGGPSGDEWLAARRDI